MYKNVTETEQTKQKNYVLLLNEIHRKTRKFVRVLPIVIGNAGKTGQEAVRGLKEWSINNLQKTAAIETVRVLTNLREKK